MGAKSLSTAGAGKTGEPKGGSRSVGNRQPGLMKGLPDIRRGPGLGATFTAVRDVLRSPGRPLEPRVLGFYQPRFGHDFARVRLHDDARAAASARLVQAPAYTVGEHIVFRPGAYRPESEKGRRLIAHELVHVIQQGGARSSSQGPEPVRVSREGEGLESEARVASEHVLRGLAPVIHGASPIDTVHRAPEEGGAEDAGLFYQEVLDSLAEERGRIITLVRSRIVPESIPILKELLALCQSVESGNTAEAKTNFERFLSGDTSHLPFLIPSPKLVADLAARLLLLGLSDEAGRLRAWGVSRDKEIGPGPLSRTYAYDIWAWERIEERLLPEIPESGGQDALRVLDGLFRFLEQILDERFSLKEEEIESDRKKRAELFDNPFVQMDRSISVYAAELEEMVVRVFEGIQSAFQVVLDEAVADLAAGRGGALLAHAEDRLENRLRHLIEPADKTRKIGGVRVETTRSEFDERGGVHRDVLTRDESKARKRSARVYYYDREEYLWQGEEKSSDFAAVFLARRHQIQVIQELYGLARDETGARTEETKENASAMAKLGDTGLRLHSDDDWRRFVVEKFELREAKEGPEKALIAVVELLERYMRAFTSHTPYNIQDFGDNHLTKTFPRDLAGQLIQDCGVYALRTAYILSLLRDHPKLNLRFRYVVMPVHVGLLITGDGLPTLLVNNDTIRYYTASQIADLREAWEALNESGEEGPPDRPGTEERFSAELMAREFISGVDIPYKVIDVTRTSGAPAAVKARLWRQYVDVVSPATRRLFGPSVRDPESPNYQFDLRYLKLLDMIKKHFNSSVIKFWNVEAAGLWETHRERIRRAHSDWKKAKPSDEPAAREAYDAAVRAYSEPLEKALDEPVNGKAANELAEERRKLLAHIKEHPDLFPKETEVASSSRFLAMFNALGVSVEWWQQVTYDHLLELAKGAEEPESPYEGPDAKLFPID